jgi:hypothetical protein
VDSRGKHSLQRVKLALGDQGACGSLSHGLECESSRNFCADVEFEGTNEGADQDDADFPQTTRFSTCF